MKHSRKSIPLSQMDYFCPMPKWGKATVKFQINKRGKVITVCINKKRDSDECTLEIESNEKLSIKPFNEKLIHIE